MDKKPIKYLIFFKKKILLRRIIYIYSKNKFF